MDCHSNSKFQKNEAKCLNLKTFHGYMQCNSSIHCLIIVITIIIIIVIFIILDFMIITVAITTIISQILNIIIIITTTAIIITIIIFINNFYLLEISFLDDAQAKWLNHFLTLGMSSHRHKKKFID